MKLLTLLCISLYLFCVHAKEYTPVQQCGPEKQFKNVAIYSSKGLCTKLPCIFKLGEEVSLELEFVNKNRIEKITTKCKAKVLGSDIDFPIPNAEKGCDYITNTKCPVKPNTDIEMAFKFLVRPPSMLESRISVDAKLQFILEDQNKEVTSCFIATAKVML